MYPFNSLQKSSFLQNSSPKLLAKNPNPHIKNKKVSTRFRRQTLESMFTGAVANPISQAVSTIAWKMPHVSGFIAHGWIHHGSIQGHLPRPGSLWGVETLLVKTGAIDPGSCVFVFVCVCFCFVLYCIETISVCRLRESEYEFGTGAFDSQLYAVVRWMPIAGR